MSKALQIYEGLPSWAKGVVVVGGIAVTYIAISQIVSRIRKAKEEQKSQNEINEAINELTILQNKGIKPTLTATNVEAMSQAIVDAVNGCGTDNQKVYDQFNKVKNQADVLLFIKIFGLRKKDRCVFSGDPRESFFSNKTPSMSLSAILQSDLSASEIDRINTILKAKGITYKL